MSESRLRYVVRDRQAIGFLLPCAKGWKSFDADGLPLGLFEDEQSAAKAVYEQAAQPT